MRRFGLLCACAFWAWATVGAAQDRTAVSAPAMRVLAQQALDAGDDPAALAMTAALLQRDPGDVQALILHSQAARNLGKTAMAEAAAGNAYRLAPTAGLKFGAAMVMAQAKSTAQKRTAAQVWLRRAIQVAPSQGARALAQRDYTYVRSRNPWALRFDLAIAPSSNVNNGSRRKTMDFFGFPVELSGDAQALSGVEATLGISGVYRLRRGERQRTQLRFALTQKQVALTSGARDLAPAARNGDFSFAAIEGGIEHRISRADGRGSITLAATAGHNWYAGETLSDYLQLEADVDRSIGRNIAIGFGIEAERTWRRDAAIRSSDVLGLHFGVTERQANGDRLALRLGYRDTTSAAPETGNQALSAQIIWDKDAAVAGMGISAALSFEDRDYPQSRYRIGGRQDQKIGVDITLTLQKVDYFGFNPTVNLRASRNRSNVALYDATDLGVTLGFRSAF